MPEVTNTNTNKTKTKTRSWQALMMAALVVLGTVAIPQAADAATKKSCHDYFATTCSTTLTVNRAAHTQRLLTFSVSSNLFHTQASYSVVDPRGVTLCRGKVNLNQGSVRCRFAYFPSSVKVVIDKPWFSAVTITARLS